MATSSKGAEGVAPPGPRVHAVVLTWNGAHLLPDCLAALRTQDVRASVRTVVVDNASADGPVAGVSAGAALLRARMLREVGLFDPAYFAYYEDVDLSLRAARAGFGSWYVRAATARHRFGASFGAGSPRQRYLLGVGHLM